MNNKMFKQNLNNQRERFVKVFNDTLDYIKENSTLTRSVQDSRVFCSYYLNQSFGSNPAKRQNVYLNNVFVTKNKTLEAAIKLHKKYKTKQIAVLNFASATTPGGGVTKGSSAQEESLCRCSTLYHCLNWTKSWNLFYNPHKQNLSALHNNDIIYNHYVTICKSDDGNYIRLPEKDFVTIDVITCAAPNLREKPSNQYNSYGKEIEAVNISDDELYNIHLDRARCILNSALLEGAEILVLGAFGCGAFRNNPYIVAKAYKEALKDYADKFIEIEFAVYCKSYEDENYKAFKQVFGE